MLEFWKVKIKKCRNSEKSQRKMLEFWKVKIKKCRNSKKSQRKMSEFWKVKIKNVRILKSQSKKCVNSENLWVIRSKITVVSNMQYRNKELPAKNSGAYSGICLGAGCWGQKKNWKSLISLIQGRGMSPKPPSIRLVENITPTSFYKRGKILFARKLYNALYHIWYNKKTKNYLKLFCKSRNKKYNKIII